MKITPYDREKLGKTRRPGSNVRILEEFANSEYDCVKIEGWTHKTSDGCTNSLNMSIKRANMHGIKAITINKEVFLIKVNKDEK